MKNYKEIIVVYLNGTKDIFLNVDVTISNKNELIIKQEKNRLLIINLDNVLKYYLREF